MRWGERKWEPRLSLPRNSGLLYHCTCPHGALWNTWKRSLEFEIQEKDMGDLYPLGGARGDVTIRRPSMPWTYDPAGHKQPWGRASRYRVGIVLRISREILRNPTASGTRSSYTRLGARRYISSTGTSLMSSEILPYLKAPHPDLRRSKAVSFSPKARGLFPSNRNPPDCQIPRGDRTGDRDSTRGQTCHPALRRHHPITQRRAYGNAADSEPSLIICLVHHK